MMRSFLIGVSCMLNIWSVMAAGAAARMKAPSSDWKSVSVSGRVETRPEVAPVDLWRPVLRGEALVPRTQVRTLERGQATFTRHGDVILMDAASEVLLPEEALDAGTTVLQKSGNVIYKVAPLGTGRRFEVKTAFLVAGVKGTRFTVQISEEGAAVSVLEGIVEVRSLLTGEVQDVTAGQIAVVNARAERLEMHRESPRSRDASPLKDTRLLEVKEESKQLDASLRDDESLLGSDDMNLWEDLSDGTRSISCATMDMLSRTTILLDPVAADVKTDNKLLDLLPLPRKRP